MAAKAKAKVGADANANAKGNANAVTRAEPKAEGAAKARTRTKAKNPHTHGCDRRRVSDVPIRKVAVGARRERVRRGAPVGAGGKRQRSGTRSTDDDKKRQKMADDNLAIEPGIGTLPLALPFALALALALTLV